MNESNETSFPEVLMVYTFLHGKDALQRVEAILDTETSLYHMSVSGEIIFPLPSSKMIEFNHFLFFQGMTIDAGMSDRIKHIDILWASKQESDSDKPFVIRANKKRVAQWFRGDYSLQLDSLLFRCCDGSIVEQRLLSHLVAVPKGDTRFLFLTFEKDSLCPLFKIVRSLPSGLSIETANSY